jgi:polygalacturonase
MTKGNTMITTINRKRNLVLSAFALWVGCALAGPEKHLVTKYGAVGDGVTLNTATLQALIDKLEQKGGGTVVFPAGKYLSGTLQMRTGVHLHLEEGSILLGSTNPYDYRAADMKNRIDSPKKDDNSQLAFIVASRADNFSISGKGMIDGQGRELALNIDALHHSGEKKDPKYNYHRMRPNETARPKLFRFSECKNVTIKEAHLQNSACWGLSFELCTNLVLDELTIRNRAYWNNDGMDITDCTDVRITRCDVDSADDGICLKSYYPGHANDGIYIADCTIRSSASAIKFGTASFGGFKNVTIENIKVYDTFRSAITIQSVDGAEIENIKVSNIVAKNTGNALFIRLGHRGGKKPGYVRNIEIKDMKVEVPFGRPDIDYDMRGPAVTFFHNPFPASIVGMPGHRIEDIRLENIEITYPGRASKGMAYIPLNRLSQVPENIKSYPEFSMFGELPAWGMYVRHADGLQFKNVEFKLENEDFRPAFIFDSVSGIKMENITLPAAVETDIALKNVKDVAFSKNLSTRSVD